MMNNEQWQYNTPAMAGVLYRYELRSKNPRPSPHPSLWLAGSLSEEFRLSWLSLLAGQGGTSRETGRPVASRLASFRSCRLHVLKNFASRNFCGR